MGFFFRKSIKFGPMRLNLSKSGIGVSAGVKGFRVSTGPRGTYLNAGYGGLGYRHKLGGGYRAAQTHNTYQSPTPVQLTSTPSATANVSYKPRLPGHGQPRIVKTMGLIAGGAALAFGILAWSIILTGSNNQTTAPAVVRPTMQATATPHATPSPTPAKKPRRGRR